MKNLNVSHIARHRGLPDYPAKEPVEIIADYLSLVHKHVMERDMLPMAGEALFARSPIDLVVTCPTIWSYSAKNLTLKAVQNAGFNPSNFRLLNEIIVVSEPVAAALYALKSIQEDEDEPIVKVGDCFVTADCGGGTVDVAAFQVTQINPAISLQEIGIGIGKKCDSTFIDSKLKKNILDRIGPSSRENLHKELPEGAIGGHQALGFVAMVGGFGCSDHLFHEVNRFTSVRRVPTKRPTSKERCWAAVARGAVMYGLQRRTDKTVYMRPAAHSDGVKKQQPFSAFKPSGDAICQGPFDGQEKAENQMTWLVMKGDLILSDTSTYASLDICRKFRAQDSKSFCTHLLTNDDDRGPAGYLQNEMRTVGSLNYNFGGIPDSAFQRLRMPGSRVRFYKADLQLHIQITDNTQVKEVKFWVTFNDQELSSIAMNYP
ncbi:uncharacterized protein A1O9_08544 [Exophiala aquamarina CBS 119918]|uniref:Uncharacterized protein n=1 Tax=Exophiala aquamarina CBS 119918 TaxID=1182545 RepID=A0A072P963_9EURO|nr:uncharacterized protein A1O9_08544 [Exophiala aquamarina CBS 119918]KEF55793.1 hypothetical protein A1O9_08544 [Exophiala aquamarina CBS 119918]